MKITKEQFYQCYGLIIASIKLEEKRIALKDAYAEIVGEENADRFWDFYDSVTIPELKKGLKNDDIEVEENQR